MILAMRRLGCLFAMFVVVGLVMSADDKKVELPVEKKEKPDVKKPDPSTNGKHDKKPDDKKDDKKAEAPKPATYKVEKNPFKIDISCKGVFESAEMKEVGLLHLEAWKPSTGGMFLVKKAVEHGARVQKGDLLLDLDTEKLDETIRDMERDAKIAELSIQQSKEDLPLMQKAAPVELASLERTKKLAEEDLKYFTDVQKAQLEESAKLSLEISQFQLDNAKEELKQLKKMYKSKDLTEETEEIILKRQEKVVKFYTEFLKRDELDKDFLFKTTLPRRELNLKEGVTKMTLAVEKANQSIPGAIKMKELSLARSEYDQEKSATRLKKLKKDRHSMTIKAPTDGVVYLGKCNRGQFNPTMLETQLQHGGMLRGEEVLFTIVKPRPLFIRAVVEEKNLHYLRPGVKGKAVPVGYPELKLNARVESVSNVAVTPGNFEARLTVEVGEDAAAIMPGMACNVKFIPYMKESTLTVPVANLFTDELDEDKHYVYLLGKDGKSSKHYVTIGKQTEKTVEVLKGLKEGDEILLEKPKDAKKAEPAKKEST